MADKKRIIIIEDDDMILAMYKTKLEQDGYEVITATNGIDGIEVSSKNKADIILLDIIMPGLDGFSVLEDLRKNKGITKTPIVLLTNLGTEEDKEKGQELGAAGYLVKASLTPAQVSAEIKKYLK